MDDIQGALAATPGFEDVRCLVVLKEGKEKSLRKMVGERRLPVLLDVPEVRVRELYGIQSSKPMRVFGRDGCVAADTTGLRLKEEADPAPLMGLLRRIDS